MFMLLYSAKNTNGTQTKTNREKAKKPAIKYLLFIITLHYRLNIFCTFMIGKTLSLTGSKFALSFQTNKQNKKYFLEKTNFFQLRKIFTPEYIKHASGTSFLPNHTNQKRENRGLWKVYNFKK